MEVCSEPDGLYDPKEHPMRFASDGYIDLRDPRRVRTPGRQKDEEVEPSPAEEALAFLLSHSFPGHRRITRALSLTDRRRLHLAVWARSVGERMALVDRVWRSMTEPVPPPRRWEEPQLIQVVTYGDGWSYPIYLDGMVTRVLPHGGIPLGEAEALEIPRLDLRKSA